MHVYLCICWALIHFVLVVEVYTPATIGYNVLDTCTFLNGDWKEIFDVSLQLDHTPRLSEASHPQAAKYQIHRQIT